MKRLVYTIAFIGFVGLTGLLSVGCSAKKETTKVSQASEYQSSATLTAWMRDSLGEHLELEFDSLTVTTVAADSGAVADGRAGVTRRVTARKAVIRRNTERLKQGGAVVHDTVYIAARQTASQSTQIEPRRSRSLWLLPLALAIVAIVCITLKKRKIC